MTITIKLSPSNSLVLYISFNDSRYLVFASFYGSGSEARACVTLSVVAKIAWAAS